MDETGLAIFDEEQAEQTIRRTWHDGRWFFSVIDIVGLLTDAPKPRQYWFDMKRYVQDEGFRELLTTCRQLKLLAADGKSRATDCADFPTLATLLHTLPALHRRAMPKQPFTLSSAPGTCGGGIYAIHNIRTQERYIGSSHDMTRRFVQHKSLLRCGQHHARRLQDAWNTYGEEAFVFIVLETLSDTTQLAAVEQAYLDAEQPVYNGATIAQNWLTLPPIAEERIQQLFLSLYDIHISDAGVQPQLLRTLREAIGYGVVKPGRTFQVFLAAAASGVETWAAFGAFLTERQRVLQPPLLGAPADGG